METNLFRSQKENGDLTDTSRCWRLSSGQRGIEAFIAVLDSLQAKQDYGAYQRTYGILRRFPPSVAAQGLGAAIARLIERQPDCAGDILSQLADHHTKRNLAVLSAFKSALAAASADAQKAIMDFVIRERERRMA